MNIMSLSSLGPIPEFCPGEFHELYSIWGCKELETTEQLSLSEPNSDMRYYLSNFLTQCGGSHVCYL